MSLTLLLSFIALVLSACGQTCQPDQQRTDCGHVGTTQSQCEASGCCWSPKDNQPWCFHKSGGPSPGGLCKPDVSRVDCGREGTTQQECEDHGCCWQPQQGAAYCYFPSPTYLVQSSMKTTTGVKVALKLSSNSNVSTAAGSPLSLLTFELWQETNMRLHFKITDPNNQRWEIPQSWLPVPPSPAAPPSSPMYSYHVAPEGKEFSLTVMRLSNKEVIFSTASAGVFYFSNQYLSFGSTLPQNWSLYGLGEHKDKLKLEKTTYTLWTYDTATPKDVNLYGSHPFYLDLRTSGVAHGVFLRNSNGMDILLGDTSIEYRTLGGVLDFYMFFGPSPEAVIQQYQEVIGRPHMPPYWALGFHQCRYGYSGLQAVIDVVEGFKTNMIPLDTAWVDIDYMNNYKDFTVGPKFPLDKLQAFVSQLHQNGQHFVTIVDPGISNVQGYEAYTYGLSQDVFIKDMSGKVFIGKVWPGTTAFPDFLNPATHKYWQHEIEGFMKLLAVDGLWIDMNEPSNFCNGACVQASFKNQSVKAGPGFDPTNPPYQIDNQKNKQPLNTKTLDMDAVQYGGVSHYDAHNLYGFTEAIATCSALENLKPNVRSFVLSRSTFPGSGAHTAHWTGDNRATFDDMYWSIPGLLNFQMFGIPLVGSDICGFIGDTSEELCGRWMQLGSFYPFSRNHNTLGAKSQEPFRWPSVAAISRKYLGIRYSLLPYYYTLFYKTHRPVDGSQPPSATVMRPLFFEFPEDDKTYSIDTQFMIGSWLLFSPQLQEGGSSINAYFPAGKWYDWDSMKVTSASGKENKALSTPRDHLPINVRGGSVIPMQTGQALNTTMSRSLNFSLLIYLDNHMEAIGDVFLDDGVSIDIKEYTFVDYVVTKNILSSKVTGTGYASKASLPPLSQVTITTVPQPSKVTVNGNQWSGFQFHEDSGSLMITGLSITMDSTFTMEWS